MAASIASGGDRDPAGDAEPTFLVTGRELLVLSVALTAVLGALLLLVATGAQVAAALASPG